jgi:hypothetical protein
MGKMLAVPLVVGFVLCAAPGAAHAVGRTPDPTMHSVRSSRPHHPAVRLGYHTGLLRLRMRSCDGPLDRLPTAAGHEPGVIVLCRPHPGPEGRHSGVVSV